MTINRLLTAALAVAAATALGGISGHAQTIATWTGVVDTNWNNAGNWDLLEVPAEGTNALIPGSFTVNYDAPAPDFGNLELQGSTLNFNAGEFTNTFIFESANAALVNVNNGGDATVNGDAALYTGAKLILEPGGSLNVTGNLLVGSGSTGGTGSGTSSSYGSLTNNGGILIAGQTLLNYPNGSIGSGHPARLTINGGVNNLGAVTIKRQPSSSDDKGLIVNAGLVTTASITVQANSYCSMYQAGGIVTNTGALTIRMDSTTGRPARFVQSGGLFVTTDPNVVTMYPNGSSASVQTYYDVNAGTNMVGGFQLGVAGTAGTARVRNFANIYIGSMGITWDGVVSADFQLNSGSILGATADWNSSAPLDLAGGTIQTADPGGNPFNITVDGVMSGGALVKTGGGTLTLDAANTYSGSTTISAGTLALGPGGSINASSAVNVGAGATFDTSAAGGFTIASGKVLSGSGTVAGAVTASTGASLSPGDSIGTLTLSGGLSESGGAVNFFELSSTSNDLIEVAGDLNLTGLNDVNITVVGGSLAAGIHDLFHYTGNLIGDVSSLNLVGAPGYLTNRTDVKMISLVTTGLRGATNVVWVGNATVNDWDVLNQTNWINGATLESFVQGDDVRFDATGAANPNVNITVGVAPGSVTVDATTDYTFSGIGSIVGAGGLTKTNTGKLTITLDNSYSGVTTIAGGTVSVSHLDNGGSPSGIGAATVSSDNLVLDGGTLEYLGGDQAINRGATLQTNGGTFSVVSGTTLTLGGTLTGPGSLTKTGDGTLILSSPNAYAGDSWLNGGTLQINNAVAALPPGAIYFNGGTLSLNVSSQQTYSNPLNVTGTGTLISAGGNNNVLQGAWSGAGTLNVNVASGGYFTINKDMTTNFTGTILLTDDSGGTFRFNGGGSSSSQQQSSGSATATFDLGHSSVTLLNRNGGGDAYGTYYLGALAGGSSTFVKGAANSGTSSTYQIGDKNLSTAFAGTIADNTGPVGIIKAGTGTLTLSGQNTYTSTTTISNGVLALATNPDTFADGSIDNSSVISVLANGVLDVSGRSDGSLQLSGSQTLQGQGVIRGSLTAYGTVAPGNNTSIGTLTVSNAINLYGTTWMKLNRGSAPNSDRLVSSFSSIMYGGALVVTNAGATLQVGDTFTLFSGDGLNSGIFSPITLPSQYTWDTSNLSVNGTIKVTGVTAPPSISTVDFSTLASGYITLNAINGTPNGQVNVLTSTNLATPLSSWTLVAGGAFDGTGHFSTAVNVDPTAPQSFFTLQAN